MKKQLDVVLINPGDPKRIFQDLENEFIGVEPPVFAGLFATYLRKKGLSVEIIDAPALGLSAKEVAREVCSVTPVLAVLVVYGAQPSASTQNMTSAVSIAEWIKGTSTWGGRIPVMMTGTHPAALPEQTLREGDEETSIRDAPVVDFVCDREGPETIYQTVCALKAGQQEFFNVPDLWWEGLDGVKGPSRREPLIQDLDGTMPGIAWDLLPMEKYRSHNWHSFDHIRSRSPYAAIHTSLGCPYSCSFCCINAPFGKSAYRMWSPITVLKEIDTLVGKYGVTNIKFVDEMFVLNPNHVLEICSMLATRDYTVNIWAYARVDTVQDQFLDVLKAAGVNWLCLGIESASDHVRDGALKKYGNDDIIDVVRRIQTAGINVIGNFIFGLPDDTQARMQETLDLALELNCEYANFYSAMAYPGSALYTEALAAGRELPEKWEDYSQHGYGTMPLANDHCTSAEILAFRDQAHSQYFANASYLEAVRQKFGQEVVDHIEELNRVPLKRKLLE